MYIESYKRCIKYWLKILKMPEYRFVKKCYIMMYNDDLRGRNNWVTKIRVCVTYLP